MKTPKLIIIILFLIFKNVEANDHKNTKYVYVNGLVCDFCARAFEKTLEKHEAVKNIEVDLKEKVITVNLNENKKLEDSVITQLVIDAGYAVREITNEKK